MKNWLYTIPSLLVLLLLLCTCRSIQNGFSLGTRDVNYRGSMEDNSAAQIQMQQHPEWWYPVIGLEVKEGWWASAVIVGQSIEKNETYAVTAAHVVFNNIIRDIKQPDGTTKHYDPGHMTVVVYSDKIGSNDYVAYRHFFLKSIMKHPKKDFAIIIIDGVQNINDVLSDRTFPYYCPVYRGFPVDRLYDITLGYLGQGWDNKILQVGRASNGQSGGAVFANDHGLHAVVSTTSDAVNIWWALQDMEMTWILGDS